MYGLSRTSKSSGFSASIREYISRSTLHFRDPIFSVRLFNASQPLEQQVVCGMSENILLEQNRIFVLPTTSLKKCLAPVASRPSISTLKTTQMHPKSVSAVHHHIEHCGQKGYCKSRLMQQLMIERWACKSAFHGVWNFWSFLYFDAQKQHLRIETRQ